MDELLEELRKFDPEAKIDDTGLVVVHGIRISVSTFERKGKTRYEIGGKKRPNAKEAAYYLVTDYVLQRMRNDMVDAYMEGVRGLLPKGVFITRYQRRTGEVFIALQADTVDLFKVAVKAIAKEDRR